MNTVLVTGGTGFLGEHVVQHLLAAGSYRVRVLARSRSPVLAGLAGQSELELVRGDILAGDELGEAMVGCDAVLHLAGMVSRNPDDAQAMMRIHVDGTRRLFETARALPGPGPVRIVVASTSGTVAVSTVDEVLDENAGYATEIVAGWPYYASKIFQEKLAFALGSEYGIDVLCVNPSLLLGPGDRRLSSSGDVLDFLRRNIPVVPDGGVNFVDVRDAADAIVTALQRGRPGERYLLGGPNWTFREFFGRLSRVAKVRPPRLRIPDSWARAGASMIEHFYRNRGKEPPFDRISVEMSQHYWWIDSTKAERELGFEARDPGLTLHDTVRYLRQDLAAID
ncbi:MAG: NAD-dependent epimerase/dehydratase family protein [Proteobacteria bacterium]|nr:NAD-dependent epimerase/dehydratase family protein [Pseudomonadota bacterium]